MKDRNQKYLTPHDTKQRNTTFYPMLEGKDGICIQPRSIALRAFCERLYALLRQVKDKSLEDKMGKAFERLSVDVLQKYSCNVSFQNAKYKYSKHDTLEIDMVVETEDRIFLIECKKKALKGTSRSGIYISQLEDLNGSFLKMLDQLTKHELKLRTNGKIKFKDGRELSLNDRKVEKIALSLFDHGSIMDRGLIREIFIAFVQGQFVATKEANEGIVSRTNALISSIRSNLEKIYALPNDYNHDFWREFMMSTWWLSIDQLYYMCDRKNGLWEGMQRIRHTTHSSRDFIYELNRADDTNQVTEALLQKVIKMNSIAMG